MSSSDYDSGELVSSADADCSPDVGAHDGHQALAQTDACSDRQELASSGTADPAPAPGEHTLLLVWDAPNLDMGLGSLLGGRPSASNRPRFDAVGIWLLLKAQAESERLGVTVQPEATVFTNVAPGSADSIRSWVEALRNVGFAVFAKPKAHEDSDVDPDMLDHIRARHAEGVLSGVVVASADGQNFKDDLYALAADGVAVEVIGFREHAAWAVNSDVITFTDLEDIAGVFRTPLPRISLENLPASGGWLQPFRSLSCLLSPR